MKPLRPPKSTWWRSQTGPVDLVVAARVDEHAPRPTRSALRAFSCEAATVPYLRRKPSPGIDSTRLWASW